MVREKEEAAQTMAEERLPKEPECVSNSSEAQRWEWTCTCSHPGFEVSVLRAQPCLALLSFLG
jgi:hypothetical protein